MADKTEAAEPILEVKDLAVNIRYEGRDLKILRDISYSLRPGRTLAIVGESGSGKTIGALSIVRLLPNSARVTAGRIIYAGRDLASISEEDLRGIRGNKISMVFQEPMTSLNPVLTIGKQLAETIVEHKNASMSDALAQSAVLLEKVGIRNAKARLNDYPHNFSGGMRQRVMIAMALSCGPDIVIADEPTTALDVTIQAQILNLILDLRKENRMSLILITHNLGIVAQNADDVLVFYAGRIMERAPVRDIFKDPKHPYTEALLNSLPKVNQAKEPLKTIAGLPPSFERAAPGCPFQPRCPYAFDRCLAEEPPEFKISPERGSKCWLRGNEAAKA